MDESGVVKTVPPGYELDAQGNLIHMVYDEGGHTELGIKGTVIPSARARGDEGGNVAFDPHRTDIPQNIVECTEQGMKVIAQITRAEMAARQGVSAQPASEVPESTPFQQSSEQPVGGASGRLSIKTAIQVQGGVMAKKQAKKKAKKAKKKTSRRVEKSPEVVAPVPVTISGIFGQIVQPFSAVFRAGRAGNLVVLATDHKQLPAAYEFPALSNREPMPLQIGWAGQVVSCLWAGISFTLPDQSVTFVVLFVNEEPSDEQGLPG